MARTIGAQVCVFRRTEDTAFEQGIAINALPGNYDVSVIVDLDGKVVEAPIWDYSLLTHEGCFLIKEDK